MSVARLALLVSLVVGLGAAYAEPVYTATQTQALADYRAAYAKRDWAAMIPPLTVITMQSPTQGIYRFHLARARMETGDCKNALTDLQAALPLKGADPAIVEWRIATCHATLGNDEEAVRWLRAAMSHGLRYLEDVRTSPVFAKIRERAEVRQLLGIVDTKAMSRTEGWRYDIRFLLDYIEKRALQPYRTTTGARNVNRASMTQAEFARAAESLSARVPKLSDPEIALELMRLMAALGDGHTALWAVPTRDFALTLPVCFYAFDDGVYVTAAAPQYKDLVGARVVSFDGHSFAEATAKLEPYINRDNDVWLKVNVPHALRHTPLLKVLGLAKSDAAMDLTILDRSGAERTVRVEADTTEPDIWNKLPKPAGWIWFGDDSKAEFLQRNNEAQWWSWHADSKLLYVQYNQVGNGKTQTLEAFANELARAIEEHPVDKLVIDMRNNNGGNTYLNEPLRKVIGRSKVNATGHLYIIIGRRVFSAATSAVSYFVRDTEAILVGEPTGGRPNSIGDEVAFTLPWSGTIMNLSDRLWQGSWPDNFSDFHAPDIAVPVRAKDYLSGHDAAMAAIEAERLKP